MIFAKQTCTVMDRKVTIFWRYIGRNNPGVKVADLGELGKAMIDIGAKDDDVFTHFIAIGPEVKT